MQIPGKLIIFLNGILLAILLSHSMYRDYQLERRFPMDLRNRVVGSRLQKDGRLPYSYYWQPSDGMRYYDLYNWISNGKGVSNITASPFFHSIFNPLFELPQRTISRIWLWLQYFLLACMILMFCRLTANNKEKWLVLNLGILFTTTEAWIALIFYGQIYFIEAFLMSGIIFALVRNTRWFIMLAGILAAAFVLTRPIGIVIFIPFLFYFRKYFLFLLVSFAGLAVYGLFVLINPYEQSLYRNYIRSMKMHAEIHILDDSSSSVHTNPATVSSNVEGFDMNEVKRLIKENPVFSYSEFGNVFVLYNRITHQKMPLALLIFCSACTVVFISGLFYFYGRKHPPEMIQLLLTGFLLYMVVDIFSPVHRAQYNSVQWLPLLFTGILWMKERKPLLFILLLAGLLLNISNFSWLPMRHTLGEFVWVITFLLLIFSYPANNKTLPQSGRVL